MVQLINGTDQAGRTRFGTGASSEGTTWPLIPLVTFSQNYTPNDNGTANQSSTTRQTTETA